MYSVFTYTYMNIYQQNILLFRVFIALLSLASLWGNFTATLAAVLVTAAFVPTLAGISLATNTGAQATGALAVLSTLTERTTTTVSWEGREG